jgi:hypothetical protein
LRIVHETPSGLSRIASAMRREGIVIDRVIHDRLQSL